MDFNPPTTGELAYGDAQEARRENAELRARVTRLELAVMVLAKMCAPLYPLDDMQGTIRKVMLGEDQRP
jgi:hypothetical protein